MANAPNAFESVTRPGYTSKFDSSGIASGAYKSLSVDTGACSDLTGAVDAIRRLVTNGPQYGYQFFVGDRGRKGTHGTRHGGSRFWF